MSYFEKELDNNTDISQIVISRLTLSKMYIDEDRKMLLSYPRMQGLGIYPKLMESTIISFKYVFVHSQGGIS